MCGIKYGDGSLGLVVQLANLAHTLDDLQEGGPVLHVAGLTRNVSEVHLKEICGRYGTIVKADLARDPKVGLSKGWAHVEFATSKQAESALLHLDGVRRGFISVLYSAHPCESMLLFRYVVLRTHMVSCSSCRRRWTAIR